MKILLYLLLPAIFIPLAIFAGNVSDDAGVEGNRQLWKERTFGENLALGKKVEFNPEPNYPLTAKGTVAAAILTDGKLGRRDDRLWYSPTAVAWQFQGMGNASLLLDLTKIAPVAKIVMRLNGGYPQAGIKFPQAIEVFVSKDGKKFYRTLKVTKLAQADQDLTDWQSKYYLTEEEETYVYPFELEVNTDTRFIGIRFHGKNIPAILDEIAAIKATVKSENYNNAYLGKPAMFWVQKAIFAPRTENFYIADNINAPNWLFFEDQRRDKKGIPGYTIDMPSQVEFKVPKTYPMFVRELVNTEKQGNRTVRTFKFDMKTYLKHNRKRSVGPLYFYLKPGVKIPEKEKYVIINTTENGKKHYSCKLPLKIIHIDKVPVLKRLNISLGWMYVEQMNEWPDFFANWKNLGFNAVPIMPNITNNDTILDQTAQFLKTAKKAGFKTINVQNPVGMLAAAYPKEKEFLCVGSSKTSSFCPAYRGKFYDTMLKSLSNFIKKYPTDYIFFDIETWHLRGMKSSMKCSRCEQKRQSAEQNWKEYLTSFQINLAREFKKCIVENSYTQTHAPLIGYYDSYPGRKLIGVAGGVPFMPFKHLYPEYSNLAQPSLYTSQTSRIASTIAKCYKYIKNASMIIPWLTAGTYGEFDSYKLEHIILTALFSGAGGFTYYWFPDFDTPLDYYYHARALHKIAPYEDLLADGIRGKISGTNKKLRYSPVILGKKMLLLVDSFDRISENSTKIKLPFEKVSKIINLNTQENLPAKNELSVSLQPDSFGLFYIEGQ